MELASDHVGVGAPSGLPLRARLPLTRDEASSVLGQIGHALVAAHAAGFAHGALSLDCVFVSYADDELFVRVFSFGIAVEDYRHVRDDITALSALANEIVGATPPNGFGMWRRRCAEERWTVAECVNELRALFGVAGGHNVGASTAGRTRRFEPVRSRRDRGVKRVRVLDRIDRRVAPWLLLAAAVLSAILVLRRSQEPARAPSSRLPIAARAIATADNDEVYEPAPAIDLLAADRGSCPDRFLSDPIAAAKQRSYRCVRAVLYQRVLDAQPLKGEERAVLKNACAALGDLGCEMRALGK